MNTGLIERARIELDAAPGKEGAIVQLSEASATRSSSVVDLAPSQRLDPSQPARSRSGSSNDPPCLRRHAPRRRRSRHRRWSARCRRASRLSLIHI
ncbi:hypothetical protein PPH41_42185, partial [Burkholderia gladioli]|nr:hypothetical protein [Burkholderia gladioli]